MNKKKIIIISIILVISLTTTLILTRPNFKKLLGSVNLMNLQAIDVPYTNNSQSNVQGAIDDLVTKIDSFECKEGYSKGETTSNGGYICSPPPICKRATTLHKETCEQTSTSSYCSADIGNGNEITYGILGTGNSLTAGEALDCKVTSTGDYTERFYYVTDLESNSDYAVLIYYKDTSNGPVAYYSAAGENWHGPVTAVQSLPTTNTWDNISLAEPVRQLYATDGGTSPTYVTTTNNGSNNLGTFDYSGYAGRLLTYKELKAGCPSATNIGSKGALTNCNYIMENTTYSKTSNATNGLWLETPNAAHSSDVWRVGGSSRNVGNHNALNSFNNGARPAIEVRKSLIKLD